MVSRMAGVLSRAAGPVSLGIETIFGPGKEGHRPHDETPATTAQRQADFARQFKNDVNAAAGREVITGDTTEEIIASIQRYRNQR
jgi:hypothetical protein